MIEESLTRACLDAFDPPTVCQFDLLASSYWGPDMVRLSASVPIEQGIGEDPASSWIELDISLPTNGSGRVVRHTERLFIASADEVSNEDRPQGYATQCWVPAVRPVPDE
ncbi:hypothetical protein [Nocardia sp. N2S4-5]|uniref:hypothetical protein n=1 Tax=Nocardia sp. N2S4-5 TaxID=3351565 RepID=UPI0037D44D4E